MLHFSKKIQYFQGQVIWTNSPMEDKNITRTVNKNVFMVSKEIWKTMPSQNLRDAKNI